ncbi:haloacid dehalogenase type II [Haloglomus irregulare]|jgi:2-haloacid dehalogenase|uniref:Haloacid dehalogenase type II n=1 Tax=Haloglomus irregulare TaxID=2234134 RepID=A0A554MX87_9EURY|nr:haloacid dehalogenase type II [Haloglomus irregulare]TSD09742.1 haloacid dehalogenase type II [Haloglomus irregulare]
MTFDSDRVETLTFDSYGTLVDVAAVETALAEVEGVADPEPVSNHWRSRSLMYTMVANAIDAYQPFYELNRAALTHALAAHGIETDAAERDAVLETYHELDVFDDVRDGITELAETYDCYVVSNGNPEMLSSMVDEAGIGGVIEGTISADEVETFKPDTEIYRHAAARTGTPIDRIAHVCGPFFDVYGAMNAGMQAVRVARGTTPWDGFAGQPDLTVADFHELADELGL